MEQVSYYMRVPLPDGSFTKGKIDYNHVPAELGISELDLSGSRVLDIAANDGFWAFWAESRGAGDVLAIDVDGFKDYDWGWDGPPKEFNTGGGTSNWTSAGAGFHELRRILGSNARRERKSIYQLDPAVDGTFDLIFNFGLLYHLRHPLLSLDRARSVCRGAMILETHVVNAFGNLPASLFYRRNELVTHTNWTGPNDAAVLNWLVDAGFPHVFRCQRSNYGSPYARRTYVACVSEAWKARFDGNPNLKLFDAQYQKQTFDETKRLLETGPRQLN